MLPAAGLRAKVVQAARIERQIAAAQHGDVQLDQPARRMGSGDRHLTANLRQGSKVIRAVAFSAGDWCDDLNRVEGPIEIAYRPVINEFRGMRKVEVHLVDWRVAKSMASV